MRKIVSCSLLAALCTLSLQVLPASSQNKQRTQPTPSQKPAPVRGIPISLKTTFKEQNAILPLVMHTLERNLNGKLEAKTAFDQAFERVMARHPQVNRDLLKRVVLNYNNLPGDIRNRGIASEFQHLDARQTLNMNQVRTVFLNNHLIRPARNSRPAVNSGSNGLTGVRAEHLPLKTLLRIATAAGMDGYGSAVKGTVAKLAVTPYDLNHLRQSGGKIVPTTRSTGGVRASTPAQLQARADAIQQYLQNADNPQLVSILKKGPKNGLILPGSILYLRGMNFGDQKDQIQIQIFQILDGGFVGLLGQPFAPDILASKGSQQELQVTLPATLPAGSYMLKVAVGGNVSNPLALSVNQPPPPAPPLPHINDTGTAVAGEMLTLNGSNFMAANGIPSVQFSRGKAEPVYVLPEYKGVEKTTNTTVFVQIPEDLPDGDYQVTYIRGWSDNIALDSVSNTVTLHVTGAPVPELSPSPDGIYSVYPGDTITFNGKNMLLATNHHLVLTPTQGDSQDFSQTFDKTKVTANSISFQIPVGYKPGKYSVQIDSKGLSDPVPLEVKSYNYDAAFTEFDKFGQPGGQYFVVLTCIRDIDGYAVTTGNHFFNVAPEHRTWQLGDDGIMFSNKPVSDRVVVSAQPFWYDPGSTGQDFSAEKHTVQAIAELATDVSVIVGEPEIGAVITAVAVLIEDILSLFPPAASHAPSMGKLDDPQTQILAYNELQQYTYGGSHIFSSHMGRKLAPDSTQTDDGLPEWKVFFVIKRENE